MPTIEISYALADSEIDAAGFPRGTWTDAAPPARINCSMRPSAGGADIAPTGTTIDPRGVWRSDFPPLPAGQMFTLHADFAGALPDDEPRVKVRGGGPPKMTIDPPPPLPAYPDEPKKDQRQDYRIKGNYDPKSGGVAIICMAVTRDANKKIRSVDAVAHAEMTNGKWVATLKITPVESKEQLTIISICSTASAR